MPFIHCKCCGSEIYVNLRGKDAEISYTEQISYSDNNCEECPELEEYD